MKHNRRREFYRIERRKKMWEDLGLVFFFRFDLWKRHSLKDNCRQCMKERYEKRMSKRRDRWYTKRSLRYMEEPLPKFDKWYF